LLFCLLQGEVNMGGVPRQRRFDLMVSDFCRQGDFGQILKQPSFFSSFNIDL
jgi:hypothetical protein